MTKQGMHEIPSLGWTELIGDNMEVKFRSADNVACCVL